MFFDEVSLLNNKLTVRGMTEGAIMAGLATILLLIGNLPFIGIFVLLFCSVPITIVTVRHGSFSGGLSAILATLLTALLLGPLSAVSGGLQYMLLGWVFGYMLYHRKSGNKTIQAGVATAAFAALMMLLLTIGLIGFTPEAISTYLDNYSADMMEMYQTSGMMDMMMQQGLSKTQVTELIQQSLQLVVRILPAMLIITRAIMAIITYFLTMQILKRLKIRIPRIQNFQKWSLPAASVWGLIVVWALWLLSDYIQINALDILTLNLMIIYGVLLFIDGLSLCSFWFKFSQLSTGMKVLSVIFVMLFFTGFTLACVLLGLADLLFDFHKLRVDNKKVNKG